MTLRLHNTLSGRLEEFVPREPGVVRMYTCGPTVWNFAHVGNYRAFCFYDLIRRQLSLGGHRLLHVMNLTDVDDRIIERADAAGVRIGQLTAPYAQAFFEDLRALRVQPAELYPRATEHIPEMVELIQTLLAGGHAYRAGGDVYFRIASFPAYGALSRLIHADPCRAGRVATDKYEKEAAADFALWKAAEARDERAGAAWEAPFGRGRPGWHIECSAMAMRYLGETLDLHAGGIDLLFPHHENEIAQSEAATGRPFVRCWLHSEHVADATGAKMSKSSANFATLRDLQEAGHDPLAVRLFLLAGAHYRARLKLSEDGLRMAAEQVRRLRDCAARLARLRPAAGLDDAALCVTARQARDSYRAALEDDLNLARGLGHTFDAVREANAALDAGRVGMAGRRALLAVLADVDHHVDVLKAAPESLDSDLEHLIEEREAARRARDFATADRLREELRARGVLVEDSREGVRWRLVRR